MTTKMPTSNVIYCDFKLTTDYFRSLELLRLTGGAGEANTEKPWNCSPLKDSDTSSDPPFCWGESPSLGRCGPNFLTKP